MVHGKNRIPYWIDRRLPGLAGPEYHAIISFGLPIEPEDSQYGESRLKTGHGASGMDFLTEISTAWNEHWGASIATILAVLALLKSMGKEIQQIGSLIWRWIGWTIISKIYRKAKTLYRLWRAKSAMRRTLERSWVRIGIQEYDNCLREDPDKSSRGQLKEITPVKPSWLNDYYVATALESLSNKGGVVKVIRYSVESWPPNPKAYDFVTVEPHESACEEALRIETNDKCVAFQFFDYCPRPTRFEPQRTVETVSPRKTRFQTVYPLKDMAPPCELCWEKEDRERDIRALVDNITKYDLANIAPPEITGTKGELQKTIAETCIESQCQAEAKLIKTVVKQAIEIRQRQIDRFTSRLQYEWREGEKEELVETLREFIKSQIVR